MLKSTLLAAAITTAVAMSGTVFASSDLPLNDEIKAKIVEVLEAEGYSVGKIKIEDGMYEAYAKKDGERYEVFLDENMEIQKIEED